MIPQSNGHATQTSSANGTSACLAETKPEPTTATEANLQHASGLILQALILLVLAILAAIAQIVIAIVMIVLAVLTMTGIPALIGRLRNAGREHH